MDIGAWHATVHRVTEWDMTEQLPHVFALQQCCNEQWDAYILLNQVFLQIDP